MLQTKQPLSTGRVSDPYSFFTDPYPDPDPEDPDGGQYGSGYGSGSMALMTKN